MTNQEMKELLNYLFDTVEALTDQVKQLQTEVSCLKQVPMEYDGEPSFWADYLDKRYGDELYER